jgi:hypothetical protein
MGAFQRRLPRRGLLRLLLLPPPSRNAKRRSGLLRLLLLPPPSGNGKRRRRRPRQPPPQRGHVG